MDPAVAAVLSILASAIATAILRYSAYHWPSGYHAREAARNKVIAESERDE